MARTNRYKEARRIHNKDEWVGWRLNWSFFWYWRRGDDLATREEYEAEYEEWISNSQRDGKNYSRRSVARYYMKKYSRSHWRQQKAKINKISDYDDADWYDTRKEEKKLIWAWD